MAAETYIDFAPQLLTPDQAGNSYDMYVPAHPEYVAPDVATREKELIPYMGNFASLALEDDELAKQIREHRKNKGRIAVVATHPAARDPYCIQAGFYELGLEDLAQQTSIAATAMYFLDAQHREKMKKLGAVHVFRRQPQGEYSAEVADAAIEPYTKTLVNLVHNQDRDLLIFPQGIRSSDKDIHVKTGTGYVIHRIGKQGTRMAILNLGIDYGGDPRTTPPRIRIGKLDTDIPNSPKLINERIKHGLQDITKAM